MSVPGYLAAWLVTVVIEVPCVGALYPGQRARMMFVCALATSVTNLSMNLLLLRWLGAGEAFLIVGEVLALVLEAAAYYAARTPRDLARAISASALANLASFGVGLWLFG